MVTDNAPPPTEAAQGGNSWAADLVAPLRDLSKPAGKVLQVLGGPAAAELGQVGADFIGGLIGNRVRQWNQRNLIDVIEKTARHIEEKGISLDNARTLPDGELYAIFSGAVKSDAPDVQEMWAGLLSSSLEENNGEIEVRRFASTLDQLSGLEARILRLLDYLYGWEEKMRELDPRLTASTLGGRDQKLDTETLSRISAHEDELQAKLESDIGHRLLGNVKPLVHLQSLGCITRDQSYKDVSRVLAEIPLDFRLDDSYGINDPKGVLPLEFETMIDELRAQVDSLAGQLGEYEDGTLVDPHNSYRRAKYRLTEYGQDLMFHCR